jgi:hypothetical protein
MLATYIPDYSALPSRVSSIMAILAILIRDFRFEIRHSLFMIRDFKFEIRDYDLPIWRRRQGVGSKWVSRIGAGLDFGAMCPIGQSRIWNP